MALFNNQATLYYNGNTINSNVVTGNLVEALSITKTAVTDDYSANDDITYVISITNTGTTALKCVTVRDNLGAYTFGTTTLYPLTYTADSVRYYLNGVLQTVAPTVAAGPPLVFSGITVPAGGNAMLIYEASVNEFAPFAAGSTITNTVEASRACVAAVSASETVRAKEYASLSIAKCISPETVTRNSDVTYTFIIQNTGNIAAEASENVAISDIFNPILSNLTVTFNGTEWTEGTNYTYNQLTGLFRTVEGQITVPAAAFEQSPTTGSWIVTPGVSILTVRGTI